MYIVHIYKCFANELNASKRSNVVPTVNFVSFRGFSREGYRSYIRVDLNIDIFVKIFTLTLVHAGDKRRSLRSIVSASECGEHALTDESSVGTHSKRADKIRRARPF